MGQAPCSRRAPIGPALRLEYPHGPARPTPDLLERCSQAAPGCALSQDGRTESPPAPRSPRWTAAWRRADLDQRQPRVRRTPLPTAQKVAAPSARPARRRRRRNRHVVHRRVAHLFRESMRRPLGRNRLDADAPPSTSAPDGTAEPTPPLPVAKRIGCEVVSEPIVCPAAVVAARKGTCLKSETERLAEDNHA